MKEKNPIIQFVVLILIILCLVFRTSDQVERRFYLICATQSCQIKLVLTNPDQTWTLDPQDYLTSLSGLP